VLSIFPALVVLISLIDLAGRSTIQTLLDNLGQVAPGSVNQILEGAISSLQQTRGSAGILALVSLAAALWSASNYIAAFMRASNAIYDVPEGRPRTSRPARASGRVRAWIGRGVVMPRAASTAVRVEGTSSSAKEAAGTVWAGVGVVGVAGTWERHSVRGWSGAARARRRADDLRREAGARTNEVRGL
jgi:virulence factor BrkB